MHELWFKASFVSDGHRLQGRFTLFEKFGCWRGQDVLLAPTFEVHRHRPSASVVQAEIGNSAR